MKLRVALAGLAAFWSQAAADADPNVVMAVEPISRTLGETGTVTFLYALINNGDEDAINCGTVSSSQYSFFEVQIENGQLTGNGAANARFDIPAGATRYMGYAVTREPSGPLPRRTNLTFPLVCDNTTTQSIPRLSAPIVGLFENPVPDILVAMATLSGDQVIRVDAEGGVTRASVAAVNIGPGDGTNAGTNDTTVRVRPQFTVHDFDGTGSVDGGPPVTLDICRSNSTTGQCETSFAPELTTVIGDQPVTFTVRVRDLVGYGARFNPSDVRVGVYFLNASDDWYGLSSAALTLPWQDSTTATSEDFAGLYRIVTRSSDGVVSSANPATEISTGLMAALPDGTLWMYWWHDNGDFAWSPYHFGSGQLSLQGDCGDARICSSVDLTGVSVNFPSITSNGPRDEKPLSATFSGSAALGSFIEGQISLTSTPRFEAPLPTHYGVRSQFVDETLQNFDMAEYAGEYAVFRNLVAASNAEGRDDASAFTLLANGAISGTLDVNGTDCAFSGQFSQFTANRFPTIGTLRFTDCPIGTNGPVQALLLPGSGSRSAFGAPLQRSVELIIRDPASGRMGFVIAAQSLDQ